MTQTKEKGFFERYFELEKNHTNVKTEVLAGFTTFVAMAYIIVVNPTMLADPFNIMGQAEYAAQVQNGVFFATCLISFFGTFLMAMYAKVPFAQAPGMGLNAFFAYTVVLTMGYTYGQALAIVFISGILFILITAVGFREAVVKAIPHCVRGAISAGIGLFLALIGLKNAGLVVSNSSTLVALVDFSKMGDPELRGLISSAIVALIGLVVIGALHARNIKGSIIIGIVVATIVGIPLGVTSFHGFSLDVGRQFSDFVNVSLFKMDFGGLFAGATNIFQMIFTLVMIVISFSLVDMFDTIGTLLGTARQAKMLVFVGVLMLSSIKDLDFSDMSEAIPSFVTVSFMPFTYSIANGIAFGLFTYVLIKLLSGKYKEIKPFTVVLVILFVLRFAFMTTG